MCVDFHDTEKIPYVHPVQNPDTSYRDLSPESYTQSNTHQIHLFSGAKQ